MGTHPVRLTLLALLLLPLGLAAQSTTVADTLVKGDLAWFTGSVEISWSTFDAGDGKHVPGDTITVQVGASGAFTVDLYPNDAASPAGTSYRVRYLGAGDESVVHYWVVPTSGVTVDIATVETEGPVSPDLAIPVSQLTGTLPLNRGGTANDTWTAAKCVQVSADGTKLESAVSACGAGTGEGDVTGPASNTDNYVPQWDGADSNTLKDGLAVGGASGLASLNASTKVVEDPANATATPTGSKIPIAGAGGTLADGWIAESNVTQHQAALAVTASQISDQHASTDITADLEEEAHASEHQHGGADEVATATPGANAIPKAEADGDINHGWIPLDAQYNWTAKHDFGGGTLEVPNSATLPATCVVGEGYMDTDATSGQRWYLCESTNVWNLQGGGGGSGSPGGSNTQIQYNNSAAFGGTVGFVWNNIDNRVTLSNSPPASATKALFMLGGTALVAASADGTLFGINPASFSGDFFRGQINGSDKWRIDNDGLPTWGMGVTTGLEWALGNAGDSGASGIVVHDGDSTAKPGYIQLIANNGDVFLYAAGGTDGRLALSGTKPGAESTVFVPTLESTDTLKNKTLDNSNKFSDRIQSAEIASPGTPASGYGYGYFNTSGQWCVKNDGGDEMCFGADDKKSVIAFAIDGGGSAITTGAKGWTPRISYSGTITSVEVTADQSGSIVIDVWKDTYTNFPPTVADTITAAAKPTLSAAQKSQDSTLTGWTTTFSAGDYLRFNVDSAATVTYVVVSFQVTKD